eukprot:gene5887-8120_t
MFKYLISWILLSSLHSTFAEIYSPIIELESTLIFNAGSKAEIHKRIVYSESNLNTGYHTIKITGLVYSLIDHSLRIIPNNVAVSLLDLKLTSYQINTTLRDEVAEELNILQEKITWLELEKRKLTNEKNSNIQKSELSKTISQSMKINSVEELSNLLNMHYELLKTTDYIINENNRNISIIDESISKVQIEIRLLETKGSQITTKHFKDLEFNIKVDKELNMKDPLSFDLYYLSSPTTWTAEYNINIIAIVSNENNLKNSNNKEHKLELDYYANIKQATGEDWSDCTVKLSTSNPDFIPTHSTPVRQSVSFDGYHGLKGKSVHRSYDGSAQVLPTLMKSSQGMETATDIWTLSSTDAASSRNGGITSDSFGTSFIFSIPYPVSLPTLTTSQYNYNIPNAKNNPSNFNTPGTAQFAQPHGSGELLFSNSEPYSVKHLLLMKNIILNTTMFTFVAPSVDEMPYLLSWTNYPNKQTVPLLSSQVAKKQIQGSFIGQSSFNRVLPGENFILDFGESKFIHVTTNYIVPKHSSKESDSLSWFVLNNKKFRLKLEERITTIRNNHPTDTMLVVIASNLPTSSEDQIKVELLKPDVKEVEVGDNFNLDYVVQAMKIRSNSVASKDDPNVKPINDDKLQIFLDKLTGDMHWAKMIQPSEELKIPYKYRLLWPEEKNINLN